MKILHNIYQGFSSAVNLVVEKNRKNNLINCIKHVIRNEETKANQAYIALGKYYFNNLRKEDNEETEFYCKSIDHANHRIERALTKLDELTIDAEDFFCDEDFESACEDLGFTSCENAQEASGWDYIKTVDENITPTKEEQISTQDTLKSIDFPSDEEIILNACDAHGGCGEDYNKTEATSTPNEAASVEDHQIPIIKQNHIYPFGTQNQ